MQKVKRQAAARSDARVFRAQHGSRRLRPYSTWRDDLGALGISVASVRQAPPDYYEFAPYDGISIFIALSRFVGRVDVGDGPIEMSVTAGDFIASVPGLGGWIDSYRGGHGAQILLSMKSMRLASETRNADIWDLGPLHKGFYRDKTVFELAARLVEAALTPQTPDPTRVDALALDLLEALACFSATCARRLSEATGLDPAIASAVVAFMDDNLSSEITLKTLAQIAGMPQTRFIRAFRNSVGETPYQHLLRRRLEAARAAIIDGTLSLADTAFDCGFSSQQHLTALFSARFGITPGAFRKQVSAGSIVEQRGRPTAEIVPGTDTSDRKGR